ncbi:chondroitin sulfate proteoglycan 5 isoform X1 [Pelobates fuscus]|uniref:chondroitin sulfate proteoglycan 5 isoform X1 n=1 Tax=Pelobates fuscus TaxID=191477 RepID=UPI002FE4AD98
MDSCWKCLAALLSTLLLRCIQGISADPVNWTSTLSFSPDGESSYQEPGVHSSPFKKEALDEGRDSSRNPRSGGQDTFSDNKTWRETKAKRLQKKSPLDFVVSATAASTMAYVATKDFSAEITRMSVENKDLSICVGCGEKTYVEGKPSVSSFLAEHKAGDVESVTSLVWPIRREAGDVGFKKELVKGGSPLGAESQEDSGSGDPHLRMPAGQATHTSSLDKQWEVGEFLDRATALPSQTSITWSKGLLSPITEKAISPDSAEIDHLLQVSRETVLQSPSPSGIEQQKSKTVVNSETDMSNGQFTPLEGESSQSKAQGAQGQTDITVVTEKIPNSLSSSLSPIGPLKPSDPPFHSLITEFTDVDYYDSELDLHGTHGHFLDYTFPGRDSTKNILDKNPHRPKPDHYKESTFDESYFYPTTSFYTDGDLEGDDDDDDDDDEDDIEESDDDITGRDQEISNAPQEATLTPKVQTITIDEKPTSREQVPHQTFILFGGELHPKFHPDINKDLTQTTSGASENRTECRNGYIKRNNSCKSLCEIYPTYCYNGGQCYIVENTGAFCRCNTQDYIWHKGMRCESIITDFQVMCVAVGTAALVVLLLFMMTVFFAKKLYLLKTENYKLRKRNRYRTPSELHNDNFSLSTIAEGSHPNVRKLCDTPCHVSPHARALAYYDNVICQEDPNAPQKVQDLPKACLKDEEPFNIQNSLSPKHESGKGDPDIVDVNCVLNNLT